MTKNIAIILAAGSGKRLQNTTPKQFLQVAGKLVIEHTISTFQNHSKIDEIAIVCHKNYTSLTKNIVNNNDFDKVKNVLNGGKERSDSALSAINFYDGLDANLLFHDASRPLVSEKIITDCIHSLNTYNAVGVAIFASDTIIEIQGDLIKNIPDRSKLMQAQTPQAFKLSTIKKAYKLALKDPNFQATDDCSVVKTYLPDEKIFIVQGEQTNIKLTYKQDLFLLDKLL